MGKALFFAFDIMLTVFILIIMFIFGMFAVHYNQFNTYKAETEAIVSRYGGFDQKVENICNQRARSFYRAGGVDTSNSRGSMFEVTPINQSSIDNDSVTIGDNPKDFGAGSYSDGDGREYGNPNSHYKDVQYGDEIHYRILVHIPMMQKGSLKIPAISHTFQDDIGGEPVSVISQVRQDSQNNNNTNY